MDKIKKQALINSGLTWLYIVGVGIFMNYMSKVKFGKPDSFLAPVTILSLFVFSASLTAFLIIGKPLQWYIDGKKKEALSLITYTLVFSFGFTLIAIALLVLLSR